MHVKKKYFILRKFLLELLFWEGKLSLSFHSFPLLMQYVDYREKQRIFKLSSSFPFFYGAFTTSFYLLKMMKMKREIRRSYTEI